MSTKQFAIVTSTDEARTVHERGYQVINGVTIMLELLSRAICNLIDFVSTIRARHSFLFNQMEERGAEMNKLIKIIENDSINNTDNQYC